MPSPRFVPEDLAHLLAPLAPEVFFKEYWNRRALYLPGEIRKFADLFGRTAFDAAVHHCSQLKINYMDERGWPSERKDYSRRDSGSACQWEDHLCRGSQQRR